DKRAVSVERVDPRAFKTLPCKLVFNLAIAVERIQHLPFTIAEVGRHFGRLPNGGPQLDRYRLANECLLIAARLAAIGRRSAAQAVVAGGVAHHWPNVNRECFWFFVALGVDV